MVLRGMVMYRIQYRISNRQAWRFLSVRKLVPFTEDELSEYRKMIADKQAPKYVPWHAVQLKQVNE